MANKLISDKEMQDRRAKLNDRIENLITQYGFTVMSIFAAEGDDDPSPPFSYTVGLGDKGLPELIVFGLPQEVAHGIISNAVDLLIDGKLKLGEPASEIGNLALFPQLIATDVAGDYIFQANHRAGTLLPAIQLVWPDSDGKFPWEQEFDQELAAYQTILFTPETHKPKLH